MAQQTLQIRPPSHGLFYMENAGGYKTAEESGSVPAILNEHQPSCFALEEEKGEGWKGGGGAKPTVNETRPSL